jgi:hypothetical protein
VSPTLEWVAIHDGEQTMNTAEPTAEALYHAAMKTAAWYCYAGTLKHKLDAVTTPDGCTIRRENSSAKAWAQTVNATIILWCQAALDWSNESKVSQ